MHLQEFVDQAFSTVARERRLIFLLWYFLFYFLSYFACSSLLLVFIFLADVIGV